MSDPTAIAATKLGLSLLDQNRLAEAIAAFDRALASDARIAVAHNGRAIALSSLGRREEAIAGFDRALALDRNFFGAHFNRALTLSDLDRAAEARAGFDAALNLKPDFAPALAGRGKAMLVLGDVTAAIADLERVRALGGETAELARDLGLGLIEQGRVADALTSFERATQLDPAMREAWFNRALALLALGRLREGWPDYERRLDFPPLDAVARRFAGPRLRADIDVAGKVVLLHVEQGLGDTIMFSRFAALVRARGAKVILEVQRPLVPLVRQLADATVAHGSELPAFDLHCPLASLPFVFGIGLDDLSGMPYLAADPARVAQWRTRLGLKRHRRVGLAWRGNPVNAYDRHRSMPLDALVPILDTPGTELIILQKDLTPAERAILAGHGNAIALDDEIGDFADTAAIVAGLDVLVTIDTSTAHLGGALGVPTWIMVPFVPDWRLMPSRTDSPWYNSVRQFRQPTRGAWGPVVDAVRSALTP